MSSLHSQIDAIKASKPNPINLKSIREKIDYHSHEIVLAEKTAQTIMDNINLFNAAIENLSKPFCPLSEKLVCTTDKTAIRTEFEATLASNREGLAIQQEIIVRNKKETQDTKPKQSQTNRKTKRNGNRNRKCLCGKQLPKHENGYLSARPKCHQ